MATPTSHMFVLLLALQRISLSTPQCDRCEQTSCQCSRQNLKKIPVAAVNLITELDLSFNHLSRITNTDFAAYQSLRSLIMNNNNIKTIQEQAFAPLTTLEKLDLSFNRLDTLSAEWFKSLFSLQNLNLLGNKYKTLGQGNLFSPLKKLRTLRVGGANLQSVRNGDFSGLSSLEEIILDGRNLQFYAEGSLRRLGSEPLKYVTLGLNGPFRGNRPLVGAILSDVSHPDTTLTLSDTFFNEDDQMTPLNVVPRGGTKRVILKNVNITIEAAVTFLKMVSGPNINMIAIEDTKLFISDIGWFEDKTYFENLNEVVLKNIDAPEFYNFPALFFLKPLLRTLRRLTLVNCKVFLCPCGTSEDLSRVEYIDVSDNIIRNEAFDQMMCNGNGVFQGLQTINISGNQLETIDSRLFTKLHKLQNIDLSRNSFHSMPKKCSWPRSLTFLNLSSTRLVKVTKCLPASLRVLDLSENDLTVFDINLPFLTDLYISGNRISSLPDGSLYPQLASLLIKNNVLHTLTGDDLNLYGNLKKLAAGARTYDCSCDFVKFMTDDLVNHHVAIADGLKSYICDSPDGARGMVVSEVRLSVFECHFALALSLLCLLILSVFLLTAGLCHKFSTLWYMKMIWAWLRAKRKPKLKKGELEYDAFVSYSEMDAGWVDAHLVPELEQAESSLRLCLHKRDFIPGGWILDNIMDAIEKSHRTLFILSQHFVNSEWCKYELDYTHFRLLDQNDDTVVLILLEPIEKENIPKKFCKLRRVMNSRTYLEWPDDDNQIPQFWQSLRAAIERPMTDEGEVLNETVGL